MTQELLLRIELCLSNYCDFCEENNFSHEDADRLDEAEEVLSIVKEMVRKEASK